jgi:hypothetical protein
MRPHPYLRAYMAGIVVPTLFLLVIMTVYAVFAFYLEVPSQFVLEMPAPPLQRAIVFPMAVVPNLWGVWNTARCCLCSWFPPGWPWRARSTSSPFNCDTLYPSRPSAWRCTTWRGNIWSDS